MKPEGENHGFLAFGKNRAIIQNSGCQKSPPQEFSPKAKKIFITFSAACTSKKYFAGRTRPGPLPQKGGVATFLTRRELSLCNFKITQNDMYRPARLCYTDINSREKAKKGVFAGLRAVG